jgi:uncharacterized protein YbjT (DUF2867 family)
MITAEQPPSQIKLTVTGATGFIGRRLVASAESKGHEVLAVVRSEQKATVLGIHKRMLFQELTGQNVSNAGFDSSVIVHLIGSSRDEADSSLYQSIVATTKTIVDVAQHAAIRRIIYLSGYGITNNTTDTYFKLKSEAESIIQNSGVPCTVFRPSYILGPGDEITPYLVEELEKGHLDVPGDGSYRFQPIYVGDMVDIIINSASVEDDKNYSYDILGPVLSFSTYVKMIAARVSPEATISYEKLEDFIREATLSPDPTFTTGELAILILDLVGPVAESCLGVRIRSLEETLDSWIKPTVSMGKLFRD